MIIYYHDRYNINLGLLNHFHPFDGLKFIKVAKAIQKLPEIDIVHPGGFTDSAIIDEFSGDLLRRLVRRKRYVLKALELPYIPLIPFSAIERRVLLPMRWAVQGTIDSTKQALAGKNCWNLSGGFHHASPNASEGFCIYNDIGIAYQESIKSSVLDKDDPILIIDVDAHHGNGNVHTFLENKKVFFLDLFNNDIYPNGSFTRNRVDIAVPLRTGCSGREYLEALDGALAKLPGGFRLAFVIAGTDVLATDAIGGLKLSIEDVCRRDRMILEKLKALNIPSIFLGGGGYGKDSAVAISESLAALYKEF